MLVFSTLHFQPRSTMPFYNSVSPPLLCLVVWLFQLERMRMCSIGVSAGCRVELNGLNGTVHCIYTVYTVLCLCMWMHRTLCVIHTHFLSLHSILFCLKGTGCSLWKYIDWVVGTVQPNRESGQLSLASVVNMLQLPLYLVWLCITEEDEEEEKNANKKANYNSTTIQSVCQHRRLHFAIWWQYLSGMVFWMSLEYYYSWEWTAERCLLSTVIDKMWTCK